MRKRLVAAALVVAAVFAFAGKVYAGEPLRVSYFAADETLKTAEIEVVGAFAPDALAFFVYANLFEDYCGLGPAFMPKGARLLDARIDGGALTVNVSREILAHKGGEYESRLWAAVAENAKQFEGVKTVTVLAEGEAWASGLPVR